ncbi:unnamed protein product [Ilex paraguariensis]|uniref:Uncharacterized protein n=1 Tax=Ilex paraguariensis TaxID=185542 RepID=A0ABC8QXB1_9AQUA
MASVVTNLWVSPYFALNNECKSQSRVQVQARSLGRGDSAVLSSDSVEVNGSSSVGEKIKIESLAEVGDRRLGSAAEQKMIGEDVALEKLEVLWDDGYGTQTVKDYLDLAKEMIKPDGGPARWFCPISCGCPLKGSPVLLFLPGLGGHGLGLMLHHKALGK